MDGWVVRGCGKIVQLEGFKILTLTQVLVEYTLYSRKQTNSNLEYTICLIIEDKQIRFKEYLIK